jgi:membrane-bound lytic murein transglycosylase B
VAAGASTPPVAAEPASPAERAARQVALAATVPVEVDGVDPVLDGIEVVATPALRRADEALIEVARDQQAALVAWREAEAARIELAGRAGTAATAAAVAEQAHAIARVVEAEATAELAIRRAEEDRLRAPFVAARAELRRIAAEALTTSAYGDLALLGTFDDVTERDRREAVRDRGLELQAEELERARRPWARAKGARKAQERTLAEAEEAEAEAEAAAATATDERDRFQDRLAELTATADAARRDHLAAIDRVQGVLADRRLARLEATAVDVDLPLVVVHAYWRAAALAPCQVPWWLLAGVGFVETRHGTAQGSRVTATGDTTRRILGIPLDGRPGVMAIADSDGGRLDDDGTWDRAVGPMQFIPGTWGRWASDATADEVADPHNLYDAALAAARYLCFSRGDLLTEPAQRAALLAYNRSVPYGTKVIGAGERLRDALELPDLPELPALAAPDDEDGG